MATDPTPATANDPEPAETAQPSPTVPGYRMLRPLGRGGMAEVYLALQESLDREVAIKVMSPLASADEAQAQRFENEARVIAKLEHPGIVGIHEVGRTGEGQLYYVMPYLARGDLSQRDLRGNESRVIEILRALLDALGYAHARGIVHRDVKAENVLFDNADRPQLTDFGIALSRRTGRARITSDGLALGSGGYMSPEQARGENVDGRADIYSLGVLAYEMLTGKLPYEAEDPLALALMHATEPRPTLPPEQVHWQHFIHTAMAKSPERRFRNTQSMLRALEALARRRGGAVRMAALVSRRWREPVLLVAIGMGVTVLAAALWWPRPEVIAPVAAPVSVTPASEIVANDDDELRRAIQRRLGEARAQFDAGDLVTPAGANAAESYLAVLRAEPGHGEALSGFDTVLSALGRRTVEAIEGGERIAARERFEQARLLAEGAQRSESAAWGALREEVRSALLTRIEARIDAHDRGDSVSWASLPGEIGLDDERFAALRARAARLPDAGDLLQDAGGPELSFLPASLGRSRMSSAFALMRNEVTRADYARFMRDTGRDPARCRNRLSPLQIFDQRSWNDPGFVQDGTHAVVCVSFEDARAYAAWLSRRTGQRYRLPTLAEWRHAAQYIPEGGICAAGNVGDRSAERVTSPHACSDGRSHTAPVRSFRPNRLGIFDLVGNASEWTLACGESGNPLARLLEKEICARRAAAGPSWRDGTRAAPLTHAQMMEPERGFDDVGFRLVREVAP